MSTSPQDYEYKVGGGLDSKAPSYVVRQADERFYTALKAGKFCYVFNSRQMGKSSLQNRTAQRLRVEGIVCGTIALTLIGTHNITEAGWYQGIIGRLKSSLGIRFQHRSWWNEREDIPPLQRFVEFIETVLLVDISQPIVLFFDEIDSVFKFDFKDDFFALIRAFHEQRTEQPEYQRLTFALLGVATPADLIQDKSRTPFNIGQAIALEGFQLQEVQPLIPGLVGKAENPEAVLKIILGWTSGQPFLVQKLCQLVLNSPDPIVAGDEVVRIERLVRSQILENWESQDSHEHLKSIRDRLREGGEQQSGRRLGLCQQIVQHGEIAADESPEQTTLRLTGLVVKRQGKLRIYNRIYAEVFNPSWFEQKLAELRPYANELNAWVDSNRQDESCLLREQELLKAKAWAEGKSLIDLDYQFLAASQEVEKRVIEEENYNLELKRQKAEKETLIARKDRKKANRLLKWSSLVAIVLIGLALFGFFTATSAKESAYKERDKVKLESIAFQKQADEAQQKAIAFQNQTDEAKQEAITHQKDRDRARKDAKIAQGDRDRAGKDATTAIKKAEAANKEAAVAKEQQKEAEQKKIEAQNLANQAKAEKEEAQAKRDQANRELSIALEGSRYERNGLRITERYQLATLDNLVEVMKSGQWLKQQAQNGRLLKNYPAISPILALRTILDSNTRLRNQLEIRQPPERILSVSYSPDQKHLATGSDTGTIRLWTASGKPLHNWSTGSAQVLGISFSPNQLQLATASSDGMIKLWDLQGNAIRHWKAHTSAVKSVSYSPDGKLLATGGQDGTVKIWTLSGEKQREWQAYPAAGLVVWDVVPLGVNVSFNPRDRNQLVTSAKDQPVRLWSISGEKQGGFSDPDTISISFSPDGQRLATNGRILNLSGKELMIYNPNFKTDSNSNPNIAWNASFSPDGKRLITTNSITASIWDLAETSGSEIEQSWTAYPEFQESGARVWQVYVSPDNQHIATWWEMGIARIWDLSGKKIAEFKNVSSINFDLDPKSKFLAIGYQDGRVQLWDNSGQHPLTPSWSAHSAHAVRSVSFSPDSQRLLTAGDDKMIRIWDISGKSTPKMLTEWTGSAYAIFSPDGQHIAAISPGLGKGLALWNLEGKKLAEWRTHYVTTSLAFSPDTGDRRDRRLLATSGDDYVAPVRLWDLSGKEQLRITPDNLSAQQPSQFRISQVSFSPNGQLLATAGIDGTAQIWTFSGLKVAQFAPYGVNADYRMKTVSFSPDGKFLVTGDEPDGKVRLWKIELLDDLLKRGCAWLKDYIASHPEQGAEICPNRS